MLPGELVILAHFVNVNFVRNVVFTNLMLCTTDVGCFVAMLKDNYWQDGWECIKLVQSTDRWCYIDLPED